MYSYNLNEIREVQMQVDATFCEKNSHTHSEVTPWIHSNAGRRRKRWQINNHENGTSQKMAYIYPVVAAATEKDLIFRIFYS